MNLLRRASIAGSTLLAVFLLGSCATLPGSEPVQVSVVDIESIPGEDLEIRMMVKLRVQNPNNSPIEYDGVYLQMDVLGSTFATGVSNQRGSVGPFGESLIEVPVSASALRMAFSALSVLGSGKPIEKVTYQMRGKLSGPVLGSTSFQSQGEIALPGAP